MPSVESNGLRVLERYGAIAQGQRYARGYRAACDALRGAYGEAAADLRTAYPVLRRHGKMTCRRAAPRCAACAVRRSCSTGSQVIG